MNLERPQNTIELLKKYNFTIKKSFGQNFLIDTHVLNKIVDAADIKKDDLVLEIGPGMGVLTQYLCEAAGKIIAVEIDKKLIPILQETLSGYDNIEIINDDILNVDIKALVGGRDFKVVSNLPYYITTPIIMALLEKKVPFTSMTLMMQEEVARRIEASPGNKDYGAISLKVQYYTKPYIAAFVPQNSFIPRPNVNSAVVVLDRYKELPIKVEDEEFLFKIIRDSFKQRRKTLQNGLSNSAELHFTKDIITAAILEMQRITGKKENPLIRGETLSLKEFAVLSEILSDRKVEDVKDI